MIRVYCSNRTEVLLAAFVRNLQRERQSEGPFSTVVTGVRVVLQSKG